MIRIVLGTAGHIDHGKTALVHALTGVDTDRLKEEKDRGITIDLGFASLEDEAIQFGIVDVPGHEGFVRNMLAGATGMDVVMLVVAADEGVMPQTLEHLAIVHLLGVRRLVVTLTKSDLVDEEWLELVRDDVHENLREFFGEAAESIPIIPTSAKTGTGLQTLVAALKTAATESRGRDSEGSQDLVRLPVDRVFSVRGTGTVVTGTLWSGTLSVGDRIRIIPSGLDARVRGLQVHGRSVETAQMGERTAVALTGADVDAESIGRGDVLVDSARWAPTYMATAFAELLPGTDWSLEHNQRVRVHAGTAEVLARVAMLSEGQVPFGAGEQGWIQLRFESPVVLRATDRFVLRSYSPVTTIGGGRIAEPLAPKRKKLEGEILLLLSDVVGENPSDHVTRIEAALGLHGWDGASVRELPVLSGISAPDVEEAVAPLLNGGAIQVGDRLVDRRIHSRARGLVERAIDTFHERYPLRSGITIEALRNEIEPPGPEGLGDAVVDRLKTLGLIDVHASIVRRPGFEPRFSDLQRECLDKLSAALEEDALEMEPIDQIAERIGIQTEEELWAFVGHLVQTGEIVRVEDRMYVHSQSLTCAINEIRTALGGQSGLGPADFKEVLPISRKHLIPLLNHLDGIGVTVRDTEGRSVPST